MLLLEFVRRGIIPTTRDLRRAWDETVAERTHEPSGEIFENQISREVNRRLDQARAQLETTQAQRDAIAEVNRSIQSPVRTSAEAISDLNAISNENIVRRRRLNYIRARKFVRYIPESVYLDQPSTIVWAIVKEHGEQTELVEAVTDFMRETTISENEVVRFCRAFTEWTFDSDYLSFLADFINSRRYPSDRIV